MGDDQNLNPNNGLMTPNPLHAPMKAEARHPELDDMFEQVCSPPKRKRAQDHVVESTLRVRGTSSFCSNYAANFAGNDYDSGQLNQSLSLRSPGKGRKSNLQRHISQVDYRHFFPSTADMFEEQYERGNKCAIVQTASGYEVYRKEQKLGNSDASSVVEASAEHSSELWRGRSHSADLPHLKTRSEVTSNTGLLRFSSTRMPEPSISEKASPLFLEPPPMLENDSSPTEGVNKEDNETDCNFPGGKGEASGHFSQIAWKATKPESFRSPLAFTMQNTSVLNTQVQLSQSNKTRPLCPQSASWYEEDSYGEDWNHSMRRIGSEDTQSPASTPFRFTSFPASLPRVHPKGTKSIDMLPPEDLPSQWLKYDFSNQSEAEGADKAGIKESNNEGPPSPGTTSTVAQDDSASLKSDAGDADDASFSHGRVSRMPACAKQKFASLTEEVERHQQHLNKTSSKCASLVHSDVRDTLMEDKGIERQSPDHNQAKSVDVSHDSTISSISSASPTPYRQRDRTVRKGVRPRPTMPPLSTPMELDSTGIQKPPGAHLDWNHHRVDLEEKVLKNVSGTRLNFNSLLSPEVNKPVENNIHENESRDLEKTVVKTKIFLKRTFSNDTDGYDEQEHGPDTDISASPHMLNPHRIQAMGSRIQFDFATSSDWHTSTNLGQQLRFNLHDDTQAFLDARLGTSEVSPIRADSATSTSSQKSPSSLNCDVQYAASPTGSSPNLTHETDPKEKGHNIGSISSLQSNLYDATSSLSTSKSASKTTDFESGGAEKKAKIRPMPDMAAFESSSSDVTRRESFSSSNTTACPPTPVRTPAWALKASKAKPSTLFRLSSLQTTKVLADFNTSFDEADFFYTDKPMEESHILDGKNLTYDVPESDLDDEIEQANLGRGCWNYDQPTHHDVTKAGIFVSFESDFVNLGLLGSGAFADVYKARSKTDGHVYAIKRNRRQFRSRRDRDRTLTEVRMMQRLQSCDSTESGGAEICPYILKFVRAWQQDGRFFCQTEICCRENCHDLISAWACDWESSIKKYPNFARLLTKSKDSVLTSSGRPALPNSSIWRICHDVLSGLKHIHSHNMVHFDIKPCNILFNSHHTLGCICKIGDFGMAGVSGTEDDGQEGDTAFMAPELLISCKKDPSADIFSLGLSLYNLAAEPSWKLPTEGERFKDIRSQDHTPELPYFRSSEMKDLIKQMINPDKEQRPTASKILAELSHVCAAPNCVDKVLQAFVSDAIQYEHQREREIAAKYKVALDSRTTPTTSFISSVMTDAIRLDDVRTPTSMPSQNVVNGIRTVRR